MKTKKIKQLENKISVLEKELEKTKKTNEFLGTYIEEEKECPIKFSDKHLFGLEGLKVSTVITYLYQGELHELTIGYLGDKSKHKLIKNSKNYFIFEDAGNYRWIVNKAKETLTEFPGEKEVIFAEDIKTHYTDFTITLGDGIAKLTPIKKED